jgi:hypothetical protein
LSPVGADIKSPFEPWAAMDLHLELELDLIAREVDQGDFT